MIPFFFTTLALPRLVLIMTLICRYTGDERRAREDQLYTRLNEPATRLSKAILKLRRRIRTAQQSGHTDASKLQGQVCQLSLYAHLAPGYTCLRGLWAPLPAAHIDVFIFFQFRTKEFSAL